jgi:hypothetical protein
VSNVPGGRRVFTSLLVVVPHEGRGGRGARPVVIKTLVRTRHVHVAACARLIVSVGLACAVADAVAASTNHDNGRWHCRAVHQAAVEQNRVDDVTSSTTRGNKVFCYLPSRNSQDDYYGSLVSVNTK